MSGMYTMAIAAVANVGLGAYSASQSHGSATSAQSMQSTTFGEQQSYAKQLADLISNPSSVTQTPGYQFQFQQGLNALMSKGAAGGMYGSGNLGTALTQYGQQFATSDLSQQEQLLASLSGLQTPTSPATYGSQGLQAQNQNFNQLGSLFGLLGYLGKGGGGLFSSGTPAATGGGGGAVGSGIIDSAGAFFGGGSGSLDYGSLIPMG